VARALEKRTPMAAPSSSCRAWFPMSAAHLRRGAARRRERARPRRPRGSDFATLHARQQPDGGFGYWTRSDGSELWLTGYALLALLRARARGAAVSARAIGTARRYLERLPLGAETTAIAQAWLEGRARDAGAPAARPHRRARRSPRGAGAFRAGPARPRRGRRRGPRARALPPDASVAAGITLTGATARPRYRRPTPYASSILRSTARDTALLVRALAPGLAGAPGATAARRGLLAARRDGRYATTQDGAWALLALDERARRRRPPPSSPRASGSTARR
jgi:uncharacterized protein YfaS (alpha-2-macroglobulin family)